MNKYFNQKTMIDGIKFDSKKEAARYQELKLLQKAKEINDLTLQPRFELQPEFKKNGKTIRRIEYIADFMYTDKSGNRIIEDVKPIKKNGQPILLEVFKLKEKMFEFKFPELKINIV